MIRSLLYIGFCCILFILVDKHLEKSRIDYSKTPITLTRNNTVVLWDVVDDESINAVIEEIKKKPTKNIYLVINTNGGSVEAAHTLVNFIKENNYVLHTVNINSISSGYILMQSLGTRYVAYNSYLMMHEVKTYVQGWVNIDSLNTFKRKFFKESDEIYKPLYKRIGMASWLFREKINPRWDIDYKEALKGNHADKLADIKCSYDLLDSYSKIVTINLASYEVVFPECPIYGKVINIIFKEGIAQPQDLAILHSRFSPGQF